MLDRLVMISTGDLWDVGLNPPCPGAPFQQLLHMAQVRQPSFGKVCSTSEGLHLQEGLCTEMFYSAKNAGNGYLFLIKFFLAVLAGFCIHCQVCVLMQ